MKKNKKNLFCEVHLCTHEKFNFTIGYSITNNNIDQYQNLLQKKLCFGKICNDGYKTLEKLKKVAKSKIYNN